MGLSNEAGSKWPYQWDSSGPFIVDNKQQNRPKAVVDRWVENGFMAGTVRSDVVSRCGNRLWKSVVAVTGSHPVFGDTIRRGQDGED